MGDTVAKLAKNNPCLSNEEQSTIPRYHFKCRHHETDPECKTNVYTRTKDILVILILIKY